MDKKQAQTLIKETFESTFDKGRFVSFVKNLLNDVEEATFMYKGNYIPDAYEQYINTLERIGKYTDGEHKIDILIAKLKKETSIERARTMQRNFVAWYLNGSRGGELKDAALVAFVAPNEEDWRFSLVKMDYRFEEGKKGRMRVKEEFTPARRWSFLVGVNENSHTAQSQLVDLVIDDERNPVLNQIEEAFNIEKVTKEFFEKYKDLFLRVKDALDELVKRDEKLRSDFKDKEVDTANFAKKLLGQIVFLYFLQKKGWFGVKKDEEWGTGSKRFFRDLFEGEVIPYKNFFNDVLEPLFYDALALDRSHIDHWNDHFQCKIPFLNGGLFDPINNYSWEKTVIDLPNDLFSNDRKDIKTGDIGNGILDIFDRYNFTVKEDEPLEKEVAVDPEMLGKVFENLLEVKDRKSKGTYYTPREIVHYMCQQSLINYLSTELEGKITKEDIETLIKYGEQVGENEATVEAKGRETDTYSYKLSESIRQNAELVDEKLASIKVCDPAIGSGAFPVGMMTEIVRARKTLSSYIKDSGRTLYNFKRDCIHNSLYGVDIDPSAVEIAKLRLWLSLVVDEDDIRQIKPLPNLDYKIMQGNSLLDEYGGVRLFDDKLISTVNFDKEKQISNLKEKQAELSSEYIRLHQADKLTRDKKQQIDEELKKINSQIKRLEQSGKKVEENASLFDIYSSAKKKSDELKRLHKEFFETTQKTKKDELKKQIERLEWDLIETTLREQNKSSELKKIEVLKKANIKPFFLWKLHFSDVFQENGGFDIVIANPPYNAELSDQERELYKNKFECVRTGRQDTAAIFVEVAKRIGNPDMQFSFILPFRLFSRKRNHGEFQIYTLNNFSILSILYLGSNVGFSANDEFMILVMSSRINYKNKINVAFKPALEELWDSRIFTKIDQSLLIEKREVNLNIARFDVDLLGKINNGCLSLETICHVKDGIVPFIREKLVKDKKADSRYVKFAGIAGRYHLSKYYFSCDDLWLCYDIKEAMRFIKDKVELRKVQLREREIFLHRKILTAQNSAILKGSIDENKIFVSNSLHSTYLRDEYENLFYLEYILALINSPAINYYHNSLRQKGTDLHPQILVSDLKKLPIKNISTQDQAPFKNLAEQILEITTTSKDYLQSSAKQAQVKEYEHQIDQMVYELYGLTKEEIKIVEGA